MTEGETAELIISPALGNNNLIIYFVIVTFAIYIYNEFQAYGASGFPVFTKFDIYLRNIIYLFIQPKIPGMATLIIKVELIKVFGPIERNWTI